MPTEETWRNWWRPPEPKKPEPPARRPTPPRQQPPGRRPPQTPRPGAPPPGGRYQPPRPIRVEEDDDGPTYGGVRFPAIPEHGRVGARAEAGEVLPVPPRLPLILRTEEPEPPGMVPQMRYAPIAPPRRIADYYNLDQAAADLRDVVSDPTRPVSERQMAQRSLDALVSRPASIAPYRPMRPPSPTYEGIAQQTQFAERLGQYTQDPYPAQSNILRRGLWWVNQPFEAATEPLAAQIYTSIYTPQEYQAFVAPRRKELAEVDRKRVNTPLNSAEYLALEQRRSELAQELRRDWWEKAKRYAAGQGPITEAQRVLNTNPYGILLLTPEQRQAHREAMQEDTRRYRQEVPGVWQFAAALALDPLNVADPLMGGAVQAGRIARQARRLEPFAGGVDDAWRAVTKNYTGIRRFNPMGLTVQSAAEMVVNRANDSLTRIMEAGEAAGNTWDFVKRFVENPDADDVARLTGRYSQSLEAKQAAKVLKLALGDDPATELRRMMANATDIGELQQAYKKAGDAVGKRLWAEAHPAEYARIQELQKWTRTGKGNFADIMAKANISDETVVAQLAEKLEDAVTEALPKVPTSGPLTWPPRFRDTVNNYLSIAFMGYNPGYAYRNAANNLLTAVVDGVNPLHGSGWTRDVFDRWGKLPTATQKGLGAAGAPWKAGKARQETIAQAGGVMRLRDVGKGLSWKSPTLALAQNFEVLASERVVAEHLSRGWRQVWNNGYVKDLEPALRQLGLDDGQMRLVMRAVRDSMSPKELKAKLAAIVGGGDLSRTVPDDVLDEVADMAGDSAAQSLREAAEQGPGGLVAAEVVASASEETATAVAEVQRLAANLPPDPDPEEVLNIFRRIDQLFTEWQTGHNTRVGHVWEQVRDIPQIGRDPIWREFFAGEDKLFGQLSDAVTAVETEYGKVAGLTDEAIERARAFREKTQVVNRKDKAELAKAWQRMAAAKNEAERSKIWSEFTGRRDAFWARYNAERDAFRAQRLADENEALARVARGKGKAPPAEPPAPVPEPQGPPPAPQAPPAAAPEAQPELIRGGDFGPDVSRETPRPAEAQPKPAAPETAPPTTPRQKPQLVGYEWKSILGEKYSSYEGGLIGARISDWDNALTSKLSKRKIVHVYWIQGEDGVVRPHGKISALKALGVDSSVLDRKADKFIKEAMAKKARAEAAIEEFTQRPKFDSPSDANRASYEIHKNTSIENSQVWSDGNKYTTIHKDSYLQDAARSAGWNPVIDNDTHTRLVPRPAEAQPALSRQNQIRKMANDVLGKESRSVKGVGTDAPIVNLARQYHPEIPKGLKLADATPEELDLIEDAIRQRAIGKAAGTQIVEEAKQEAVKQTRDRIAVTELNLDPERLQYKLETDPKTGTTRIFSKTKTWNPALGRGISVWIDPADGKTYVVNGHHRVELARRLGVEYIEAPYYIRAKTAEEARLVGALQNIAEGRGTPVDAAKVFRQMGVNTDLLDRWGLALTESNVDKGFALANLNDTLFNMVVQKHLQLDWAIEVGRRLPDHDMQMQLFRELDKQLSRGKKIDVKTVAELADDMANGPVETFEQAGLFGVEEITESAAFERAEFYAYVRDKLASEKRLFGTAAKNAEQLSRVGQIDKAAAGEISSEADRLLSIFDTVKNQVGPVRQLANEAANLLKQGKDAARVKAEYYEKLVTEAIPAILRGDAGPTPGSAAGAGPVRPPQAGFFADETGAFSPYEATVGAAQSIRDAIRRLSREPQPVAAMTPDQQAALTRWIDQQVIPDMVKRKAVVSNYATEMRNFALGDYAKKRHVHSLMSYVWPYSYWYSFTLKNWAQRLAYQPAIVSQYARYRELLANTNREYYRAVTGDPTAEMPPGWDKQIRVPFAGTTLHLNLEKSLNPLQSLTDSFKNWELEGAPFGDIYQMAQEWGPTLWSPMAWAYAAALAGGYKTTLGQKAGFTEPMPQAARSITSVPFSPAGLIKSSLALLRDKTGATFIPPGGLPNALFYWDERQVSRFLYDLYKTGTITATEYENAPYFRGEDWQKAEDKQAIAKLLPRLASWALGGSFKFYTPLDMEVDAFMQARSKIFDMPNVTDADKKARKAAWDALYDKYPWGPVYALAREMDATKRLEDYSVFVLKRLPPGAQGYEATQAVGITDDLRDKFFQSYSTEGFTEAELATWRNGIEELGQTVLVPDPNTKAAWDKVTVERKQINEAAAQAAGLPLAELLALQDQYYAEKDKSEAAGKAFLAKHPELKAFWDARSKAGKTASPEYNELFPPSTKKPGKPVPEGYTSWDEYWTERRAREAEAKELFGDDILDLEKAYASSGAKGSEARKKWAKEHPEEFARLMAYWDWKYQDEGTTPQAGAPRSYGGGGGGGRRSYGGGGGGGGYAPTPSPAPPTPGEPPRWQNITEGDFMRRYENRESADPGFSGIITALFGRNFMSMFMAWLRMTPEQRRAWEAQHPNEAHTIALFMGWFEMHEQAYPATQQSPLAPVAPEMPQPPGVPPVPQPPGAGLPNPRL